MLTSSKKLLVTLISVSLSCVALTACGGGGVDDKPNLTDNSGKDNTDKDNSGKDDSGKDDAGKDTATPEIALIVLQKDIAFDKYEDGEFISKEMGPNQFLQGCELIPGKGVERCGLLTYSVSGNLSKLLKVNKDKPVTVDYELVSESGNIADILKDPSKKTGTIKLYNDHIEEKLHFELKSDGKENPDWQVSLKLSNPKGGAKIDGLSADSLQAVIKDAKNKNDDSTKLKSKINDTGVTYTGLTTGNETSCTSDVKSNQDCALGRDTTDNDSADGIAGFSFTKLDATGAELAASATEWECIKDNTTGLIWERKTYAEEADKRDYRYFKHDYVYYDATSGLGIEKNEGDCKLDNCTTASYIAKLNEEKLCGISNWRLPNRVEIFDIADLNTRENAKVMHSDWLYDIATDYDSKPDKKIPSQLWTSSVAASYDKHDGYSGPYSLKFNHVWVMYSKGVLGTENPDSKWSTGSVLAVSGQ